MSYHLPDSTTLTITHTWNITADDRPTVTETVPCAPKQPLRTFRAHHIRVDTHAGAVTNVRAAGVVQRNGQDTAGFASETWHTPPWPEPLTSFINAATGETA